MLMAAAIQMTSTDDVAGNLVRAEKLICWAVRHGAKLISLPENFAYMRSENEEVIYHQRVGGELTDWLAELARRFEIYLLGGSFPEEQDAGKVYNTSLLIDPIGKVCAHYRKIHLFDATLADGTMLAESRYVAPGNELAIADINSHKVGLTICYDLRFPELYRRLTLMGAELIFVPSAFTVPTGRDHWEALLRARAIENQVYIIAPAQFGQHNPKRASYGRAMIIDPWGTVLAKAPDRECVVLAEIDFDHLARVRSLMPCRQHIRLPI
ncbi:MAG: carbon-nitrogen hydrolase family protein [Acidobacteriota bacterium]